jgi:extracellular elastinolytic metalloproteinase
MLTSAHLPLAIVLFTLACASASTLSQPPTPTSTRALEHVRAQATVLGVSPTDLADLIVTSETTSPHTGVTHVYVRQRFRTIEIVGADITVTIGRNGSITHQAGSLVPRVATVANRPRSTLPREDAATRAAKHVNVTLADAERKTRPAKIVYHPVAANDLRLAWQIDIETKDGEHQWVVTVDAVSGALLDKFDRVVSHQEDKA